jgi:tRNA nucleotidyltransferase (CCA-adding enzyme)
MYPQVTIRADELMAPTLVATRRRSTVEAARRTLLASGARVLVVGSRRAVREEDLERLTGWGLGALDASDVAWIGLPLVRAEAAEPAVRRLLSGSVPLLLVTDRRRIVGAIDRARIHPLPAEIPLGGRLEPAAGGLAEARAWLFRIVGKVAESRGVTACLVGGGVRDLLLGRVAPDVDLAVEGDGIRFAERLADEVGGRLVRHTRFGTASIEDARSHGGVWLGRIDVASTRREEYRGPGHLPRVAPARIEEDLARRDFSINAMAVTLSAGRFGRLLDPHGGRADLERSRLEPLSPLSFVEDPTRVFRAARYCARLGARLGPRGRRALGVARRAARLTGGFPALSGERLRAELDLVAKEQRVWDAARRLLRWRALELWDPRYRVTSRSLGRIAGAERLARWAERAGVVLDVSELALAALLVDQDVSVRQRCLERLAFTGGPRTRLVAALTGARPTARALARVGLRPSAVAARLRAVSRTGVLAAWLVGGRRSRRRVEWYLAEGQAARPRLRGEDVVALGVPPGPQVGAVLGALRDDRLDGKLRSEADERAQVVARIRRRKGERG